jgi:signal transduction histidine kinase/CheY-like chemotaxis protein
MTWLARLTFQNIAIALAYFLLGKFGLQIALPPGYVSAIWPAAGLAFATTALLGGRRIGCGIFLGSVLVNASVGGGFHLDDVAVSIAIGSTLQALVGGYWLRRSMPTMLLNGPEQVLRFSLIGISSAVIAATVGNLVLWGHGFISLAEVPRSFVTWWLGDAFGVQTFAPLTLLALAPNDTWKRRRLSVGIPILLSFLMSGLVYYFVLHYEEDRLQNQFTETIEPFSSGLLQLDRIHGQALRQLADFYNVQDQAPGVELQKLADNALRDLPIFRAINWAIVMDAHQSAGFAGTIRYPIGFKPNASGLVAPVQMITPLKGNEPAFGLDLMGEERRFNSIQKALATGQLTMTQPIRLAQDPDGPGGALISAPVQNSRVRGVVSGVMDWGLIGDQLKVIPGIQWELHEVQNNAEQLVWNSLGKEMPHFAADNFLDRTGVYRRIPFDLADRHWVTILYLPNAYLASDESLAPLFMLMLALLASGVFSTFALILSTHRERVEFEVMEKTAELKGEVEQRRNVQAALEQSKNLAEEASLAKSDFLANMSHEIRTPMNAVLGLLNLLQSTELTGRQRDYATKAHGAARSLLSLLNDILDFSKAEAGKMTLESEPFRIDKLMRDLGTILSANVGTKDIEVLFDVDVGLPAAVRGDFQRILQVLINLGGNAVKFTSTGQVVVSLKKVALTQGSVTINFAVQDTGIGIAPEHQAYIFTGFSQAEGSTSRRFGGSGLGLSISKRFVQLMGGDIELTSAPGVGSTFSFSIEMPIVEMGHEILAEPDRSMVTPKRVLVVDDNPIAGELTLRMVRSWGWPAELATSGKQALEMITAQGGSKEAGFPYPVICMDWTMPEMDGWEATRHIRQLAQIGVMPQPLVMMITAHGRQTLAARTEAEQGMINGFLVKPITASMLYDSLADAVSGNSSVRKIANGRSSTRQLSGMRILVVEDNLINQQVADELLTSEGAIVSLAANGQLGVEAVAAAAPQFDVVLMDVQMPVLDGYGATRMIRSELGFTQLPIVAMTANAMASDREACIASGMNEHIGKPFDMAKLVSLLIRITGFTPVTDLPFSNVEASTSIQYSLPKVDGLDLAGALARLSGSRDLYVRASKQFIETLDGSVGDLYDQIYAGKRDEYLRTIHTLKGNSATLGANDLTHAARSLELKMQAGDMLGLEDTGLAMLAIETTKTKAMLELAIANIESSSDPLSSKLIDPVAQEARELLTELAILSKASDFQVLERFAEARSKLAGLPDAFLNKLEDGMQSLDLEMVNDICTQAIDWIDNNQSG